MSSEPLTTRAADAVASERGLMIVMLFMVLAGAGTILAMMS
jgi:hypothetical protein